MGSPAGVRNASMRVKNLGHIWLTIGDELLELGHLAHFLESENLILLVTINSKACGVVTAVF